MPPAPRPLQPYNIIEFVGEYLDLAPGNDPDLDDEDEAADRARRDVHASSFALTGQHPEHYHQAVIQPLNHQLLPNIPYTVQRDYDSLLGFTDRSVLINLPINVFTAPREEETLKSNIHVEVSFQKGPYLVSGFFYFSLSHVNLTTAGFSSLNTPLAISVVVDGPSPILLHYMAISILVSVHPPSNRHAVPKP